MGYIKISYALYIEDLCTPPINNYHWELKVFAPFLWGKLYKNQRYIINKQFMYPSWEEKCIKMNYYQEFKIFASFL